MNSLILHRELTVIRYDSFPITIWNPNIMGILLSVFFRQNCLLLLKKRIMDLPWISTLQKNLHSVLAVKEQYPLKVILYWVNNIMPYSVPMKIGCFERGGGGVAGMPKPNEKETTNSKCWILSLSYEYFQGVESQDSKFIFGVSQRNTPWQRTRITNVWKGSVIKVLEFTRIGKL